MQNEESFKMLDEKAKHCYFVISKVDADGNVLVVNCSTYRDFSGEDTTCILNKGEHPFIKQTSYIPYNRARIMAYEDVLKLSPIRDVSPELYEKLRNGAKKSEQTPQKILVYILNH